MPIAKGEPWGRRAAVPPGAVEVASDAEAREVLESARRGKRPFPPLVLLGGDLFRTLGGGAGGARPAPGDAVVFTIDVGEALVDGRMRLFVAHLVARSPLWGRGLAVMNAQWLGRWNLGPRAHPNDGLLDTYHFRLPPVQRVLMRSRLLLGAHLPHPAVVERRTAAVTVDFERPLAVRVDGAHEGTARSIAVRCSPDAATVALRG